jgi:hypothetical protein
MKKLIAITLILCFVGLSSIGGTCNPSNSSAIVKYEITGTASEVNVTLTNATGGTEQYSDVSVPHTYTFDDYTHWFLYISAQNQGESGSITATVYLNGEVVNTATSEGAYVIATASYSRL